MYVANSGSESEGENLKRCVVVLPVQRFRLKEHGPSARRRKAASLPALHQCSAAFCNGSDGPRDGSSAEFPRFPEAAYRIL